MSIIIFYKYFIPHYNKLLLVVRLIKDLFLLLIPGRVYGFAHFHPFIVIWEVSVKCQYNKLSLKEDSCSQELMH